MQAGFAAMVFSAKARKSDSDTYPGRPSILLSDSQLYTPGRLENLRNHFPMGVPCLCCWNCFRNCRLSLSAAASRPPCKSLPRRSYSPSSNTTPGEIILRTGTLRATRRYCFRSSSAGSARPLFYRPDYPRARISLRIVFAIGSGCVPEQFPVLTEGLLLYPAKYAPTHFFM